MVGGKSGVIKIQSLGTLHTDPVHDLLRPDIRGGGPRMHSVQTDSLKAVFERAACRFGHVSVTPGEAPKPPGKFHTRCHGVIQGQHVSEPALADQNTVDDSLHSP